MRRMLAWLALVCLLLGAGCRPPAPRRGPDAPAPPPEQGAPAPAPPGTPPGQPAADPGVPDLAGGPEDGNRPHFDPPAPPKNAYLRGDRKFRIVALTFDDGPDGLYTPQILDVLKKQGVKATFFLVGRRAQARPDLVRRIVKEGHDVGNHSWDHAQLAKLKAPRMRTNLRDTDRVLRKLGGKPVRLFRPPYGALSPVIETEARALGYRTILWNVDSLDWKKGQTRDDVLHNVLPRVRNGSIILLHSAGGKGEDLSNTVQALPLMIKTLRGQGYRLVTISELLATGRPRPGQW